MQINVNVDFGQATLDAINNLAAALTGATPKSTNPLKSVPKADNVEKVGPANDLSTLSEAQLATAAEEPQTTARITREALRQIVQEKAKAGKTDAVKAILAEIGVKSVSTLQEEQFQTFYSRVNSL